MITQSIIINLIPSGIPPRIKVSQYDTGAEAIEVTLLNGAEAYEIPADATVLLTGRTSGGQVFTKKATTASGSVATFGVIDAMTASAGTAKAEVEILDGQTVLGSANFDIYVEPSPVRKDNTAESDWSDLQAMANTVVESADAAKAWAVGPSDELTAGTDTNNAKAYAEQAKEAAEKASAVSGVGIATTTKAGIVKVDDDTIKVDADGTLRGAMKVAVDDALDAESTNPVQNKAITAELNALQTLTIMLSATGAARANSFIYEYDLGTSFTAEQSADIRGGKFDKVRTGGYWTINGTKYWAGHADYRLHCGDTELTTHHMLVFPDKSLYNAKMNSSDVTTGGYYGSQMVTSNLNDALAKAKADFGADHILTYRALLTNAVSNGASSGWAWYDRQIDLMNQVMVYGHVAWAGNGYDVGCDKSQIALFQARPDLITNRENWWLRDVRSSTNFCNVLVNGNANSWNASVVFGVRPAFLIY